jgi:hypothetical protein
VRVSMTVRLPAPRSVTYAWSPVGRIATPNGLGAPRVASTLPLWALMTVTFAVSSLVT